MNTKNDFNIAKATYLNDFKVHIFFNDGVEKTVDLKNYIKSKKHPFFQSLKNIDEFKKFKIHKTLIWQTGADIAPEFLHDDL